MQRFIIILVLVLSAIASNCLQKAANDDTDVLALLALALAGQSKTFAYITSGSGGKIIAVEVASSGTMQEIERYTVTTPNDIRIHPTLKVAYVTTQDADTVLVYSIDTNTGKLSLVQTVSGNGMNDTRGMAISPGGEHLYVTNLDGNSVTVYSINGSTGQLTFVENDTTGGLNGPSSVAVTPNGSFVEVASQSGYTMQAYTRSSSDGTITASGTTIATGTVPVDIGITSDGKYLYTPNFNNVPDNVSAFSINQSNGQLTSIETEAANNNASIALISPNQKFLFSGSSSNKISRFGINADGSLTTKTDIDIGTTPINAVFSSDGARMLWTTGTTGQGVLLFSYTDSGALTQIASINLGLATGRIAVKTY